MAGYGTGSPLSFRCSKCRKNLACRERLHNRYFRDGWLDRVVLTGRTRTRSRASSRHGTVSYQYRCLDCGHVGWSAHVELSKKSLDT